MYLCWGASCHVVGAGESRRATRWGSRGTRRWLPRTGRPDHGAGDLGGGRRSRRRSRSGYIAKETAANPTAVLIVVVAAVVWSAGRASAANAATPTRMGRPCPS